MSIYSPGLIQEPAWGPLVPGHSDILPEEKPALGHPYVLVLIPPLYLSPKHHVTH